MGGNAGERVSLAAGMEDGVQRNTLLDDDLPFPHVRSLHSPEKFRTKKSLLSRPISELFLGVLWMDSAG